jgi:hypothetical protein
VPAPITPTTASRENPMTPVGFQNSVTLVDLAGRGARGLAPLGCRGAAPGGAATGSRWRSAVRTMAAGCRAGTI